VVAGAFGSVEAAYVFDEPSGGWADMTETVKLTPSDPEDGSQFGHCVSVSGDVVVVGAFLDDHLPTAPLDGMEDAGSAYVYRFDGIQWNEEAKLIPSDVETFDVFGWTVAVDDGTAVVGSRRDDEACPSVPTCDSGSAYFYAGLSDCNTTGTLDLCDVHDGTSPDVDGDGIPDECQCPWDIDADGVIGFSDLLVVLATWGTDPGGPPDFDGDGIVGFDDLLVLLAEWGTCP
jgi:hypothetical protein